MKRSLRIWALGGGLTLIVAVLVGWMLRPAAAVPPSVWQSAAASGPRADSLPRNFGAVEPGILYRSAQPRPWDLLWLRAMGIRSIVNLRETQYDDGASLVHRLGFHTYRQITIDNHTPPTDAQAHEFLQFVQDQRNWPILVHCAEGEGRTGTLIALTRYAVDGWAMDRALAEANLYAGKTALSDSQRAWLAEWARHHSPGDQRDHTAAHTLTQSSTQ